MSQIFLIGMPGSGKTYWGRQIAATFHYQFIDIDELLVEKHSSSITNLFARHGEDWFRQEEAAVLREIGVARDARNKIIACGGGTPCYKENISFMKANGCVVYMQASISILAQRLAAEKQLRPLLAQEADLKMALQELLDKRIAYYEQAHVTVDAANLSLNTFEQIIDVCTNRH